MKSCLPGKRSEAMPWNSGKSWLRNLGRLTSMIDLSIRMFSFSSGYLSYKLTHTAILSDNVFHWFDCPGVTLTFRLPAAVNTDLTALMP